MIDCIVPYHKKDRALLSWCINGIRQNLEVSRIIIVCSQACEEDVKQVGAIFLDEDSVVQGLTGQSYQHYRWSWYWQQILKLAVADIVATPYYLVVDSDTVFLRPVSFFNDLGRPLYATATEFHSPYFDVFYQLLRFHARREYSFTVHHMIYNREIVIEMRNKFRDEKPWWKDIVRYIEPQPPWNHPSQVNEQETYGHYVKEMHPEEVNIRPLQWRNVNILPNEQMIGRLAEQYDFCSFHAWAREGNS